MNYYVFTTDKRNYMIDGFLRLADKYWKGINFKILGFKGFEIKGSNGEFVSMGTDPANKDYAKSLIDFFSGIEDKYFFFCFDDHFLIKPVDLALFSEAGSYMENDPTLDKIWLGRRAIQPTEYSKNFYLWKDLPTNQDCLMPSSFMPSIWRKQWLLDILTPNKDFWQMEKVYFSAEKRRSVTQKIIYPKDKFIYHMEDFIRKGIFNPYISGSKLISEEDKEIFFNLKKRYSIK